MSIQTDRKLGIRPAAPTDLPAMAQALAEAFLDDPFMTWWLPDPERRRQLLPVGFGLVAEAYHAFGGLYVTDPEPVAAAVWVPAERQPTDDEQARLVGALAEAAGDDAARLLHAFELMAEQHPERPHDYLFMLGTRPRWQNRGLGSALLRAVLDRCDRNGVPAYLEATSPDNVRLYQRHGFAVTGEIPLPDGPSFWLMWRDPAPA